MYHACWFVVGIAFGLVVGSIVVYLFRLVRVTILEHDLRIRAETLGIIPQGDKKAFRRYLEMANERHRDGVGQ